MRDRGSMLVLVLFVGLALTAAITMSLVPVLTGLTERQRARSAADASALAGAIGGRASASDMARRNQAVLVGWSERGDEVVVTVRVGDHEVSARATDGP